MQAILMHPDMAPITIALENNECDRLQQLQHLVGGPIEAISLPDGRYLLTNEYGKLAPHLENHAATALAHQAASIPSYDYIAGVAIIVPRESVN